VPAPSALHDHNEQKAVLRSGRRLARFRGGNKLTCQVGNRDVRPEKLDPDALSWVRMSRAASSRVFCQPWSMSLLDLCSSPERGAATGNPDSIMGHDGGCSGRVAVIPGYGMCLDEVLNSLGICRRALRKGERGSHDRGERREDEGGMVE
jgi:hypothetical protein